MGSSYDFVITNCSLEKKLKKDPGAALICFSSLKMVNIDSFYKIFNMLMDKKVNNKHPALPEEYIFSNRLS